MSEKTLIQPAITGYRQLSEADAALMNEIKAAGIQFQTLCAKVSDHIEKQYAAAYGRTASENDEIEIARLEVADPRRWHTWGRDGMQLCLMQLVRAVAQPSTF